MNDFFLSFFLKVSLYGFSFLDTLSDHSMLFLDGLWLMHEAALIHDQIHALSSLTVPHSVTFTVTAQGRKYSCRIKLPLLHRVWLLSIYSEGLFSTITECNSECCGLDTKWPPAGWWAEGLVRNEAVF